MTPIRLGAAHQSEGRGSGGGNFGELPEGTYPISLRWDINVFAPQGNMPGGPKLRLLVTGNGVTERLSAGSGAGIVLVDDGKAIDNPTNPGWMLNRNTKGAAFIRAFEKALKSELSENWTAHDGAICQITRMDYPGMGGGTFPMVMAVTGKGEAPASPETRQSAPTAATPAATPAQQPLVPGNATPLGMDDPLGHYALLKETIANMTQGQSRVELNGMAPDVMAKHLPASIKDGDTKIAVVKLLMSPEALKRQDGWLYDEPGNAIVVI